MAFSVASYGLVRLNLALQVREVTAARGGGGVVHGVGGIDGTQRWGTVSLAARGHVLTAGRPERCAGELMLQKGEVGVGGGGSKEPPFTPSL